MILLNAIQRQLEEQRATLHERIQTYEKRLRAPVGANPKPSDLAADYGAKERRTAMLEQFQSHLMQVDSALQRLGDGTYGTCAECGRAINPERLTVLPSATLCIHCQSQRAAGSQGWPEQRA